ncbi:MAG: DUF3488 and transglutaminase-like domain-containing protein [Acidimicrobiia bacterium]|nr:DUF3488 and transglutaminase-like domain-containing protein [Acidimicrobiia bacterium]
MVNNTLSRVAGIAAFGLMISRLGRLLETSGEAPAWHLILMASTFLGGVIWWLVNQTVTSNRMALLLFGLAGGILFLRIAVPQSLIAGFFPGLDTPGALITEVSESFDIFRFGVSPVFPSSGIVAFLAVIMWGIGGVFVWGASGGPVVAMSLPSIAIYLQFGVMDRQPAGRGWMLAAATVFALAIAAMANDQRSNAGRVRDQDGRPLARRGGSMAAALAALIALTSVSVVGAASSIVPEDGNVSWRTGGGYGEGFGGVAYNRLVGLQKLVNSRSDVELFRATVDDNAPPASQIYWRMESLDRFNGQSWLPTSDSLLRYSPSTAGGDPTHRYQGTVATFTQRIQIAALRGPVAPTAGTATALQSDTEDINQFQVAPDGSLVIQSQLDEGMTYQVEAQFPLEKEDIAALATGPNGQLTTLFAEASRAGAYNLTPSPVDRTVERPVDLARFTELPEDTPTSISSIAREKTAGAQSDFERATLLQHWFRDSGEFTYSTDITPGHTNLKLADWLTDETSTDYRVGYCEQFAASMAVLGRSLGIPSRVVWGFTPGDVVTQSNGTEAIVVRDRNAHSWVEMWMDGFGWVKFDPTPRSDGVLPESYTAGFNPEDFVADVEGGSRTIDQPNFADDPLLRIDESDNPIGERSGPDLSISWWAVAIPILVLAALAIPALKKLRRNRRLRTIRHGDVTAAWDEIVDQLTDLGHQIPEFQTPIEFARSTDRSLVPLATAYGASLYGGHENVGKMDDLLAVEGWVKLKYESGQRMRASFNPTSLVRRRRNER